MENFNEQWVKVDYAPGYEASTSGEVRSCRRGLWKNLSPHKMSSGHLLVCLYINRKPNHKLVHRIIASVFLNNPENKETVNHINGIKTDNRVENLEWATYKENSTHAFKIGLTKIPKGEDHHLNKMTKELANRILSEIGTHQEIADRIGIHRYSVSAIKSGRKWHEITGVKHIKERRLTREEVLDIFSSELNLLQISEKHNIRETLASGIRNGWIWSSITGKKRIKGDRYLICG